MNELALFAGAGGGLLASKWMLGWRTVCYVENAEYPVKVLRARIRDGYLDDAPVWDDARTFDGKPWRGCVDIITAGFPCQPFSQAGMQRADGDERNMWPDTIRIIREVQPQWCLLENVSGLLTGSHGYFGTILRELAESGYDARWRVLSAAEVGAPHKRDRLWIVAHAQQQNSGCEKLGCQTNWKDAARPASRIGGSSDGGREKNVVNAQSKREAATQQSRQPCGIKSRCEDVADANSESAIWSSEPREKCLAWNTEPDVGRVAYGVAARVDRLRAIGNGQVPIVAKVVWGLLTE